MEAQTKKVSVIIPVYNAEKYIRKTLDSVLAQSFRNREILLVENGCEDQSTEILREYKEKYDEISGDIPITVTDEKAKICPRCGSMLVLRTAKKGTNAGKQFWGCSAFPKCRYVKNV